MSLNDDWEQATTITQAPGQATAPSQDQLQQEFAGTKATPTPSMGEVAMNAVPKGIANLLNTPMTLASLIMHGIANLPGAGHLTGLQEAAKSPDLNANVFTEAGTQMGLIDPSKNPQTGPQRVVDTAIQSAISAAAVPAGGVAAAARGAAVGAISGGAAQTTKELTGSDLLAIAVGMGSPFAVKLVTDPSKRFVSMTETKRMTLKDAQEVGYVVEPSSVRQPTSKLETIAGKASIAQEASFRNQEITNGLAAKSLGLPEDTPLSLSVLEEVRKRAAKPYEEVAGMSREAAITLEKLKQARSDASGLYRFYDRSADPSILKQAKTMNAEADSLEKTLEDIALNYGKPKVVPPTAAEAKAAAKEALKLKSGVELFGIPPKPLQSQVEKFSHPIANKPELLGQLRAARQLYARSYDVERALNLGDGNISAPIIGRMVDQGKPLTGELRVIGKFAQAFPRVAREVSGVPPSGVSGTDAAGAAILSIGGAAASGSPLGAVAGGLPLLRTPARNKVLSQGYQAGLLTEPPPPTSVGTALGRSTVVGSTVEEANQP